MDLQANAVAEIFANRLGGAYRLLHLPEGLSAQAAEELARVPQVREALELLRHADVLMYSVSSMTEQDGAQRLGVPERGMPEKSGAVAEALGVCFDASGRIVGGSAALVQRFCEPGRRVQAALAAVGAGRAEAIISVCAHRRHRLLVTDEGAALRILELLRV